MGVDGAMVVEGAMQMRPVGDATFAWPVRDGWQQGRGAWGGLLAGGVAHAVGLTEPSAERSLRTLSLHLAGPLPVGEATVHVSPLRVGSGLSTWAATVVDEAGDLCAHAVALTGRGRVSDLAAAARSWSTPTPPKLATWQEVEPLPSRAPGMPVFLRHLELRSVQGLPLGGHEARCLGYVRFADQQEWDARLLFAVVDAWYPTVLTVLETMRPLATVAYAAQLLVDPSTIPAGEPLAYEAFMVGTDAGFTSETRRLWTSDGRLVVENQQSIVVIA